MSQVINTKHKSPAKRVRDIKRLLSFLLRKFKEKPSIGFSPPPKQDDDRPQHQLPDNPFTLSNFLSLTRSRSQNEGLEQRRLQEQI